MAATTNIIIIGILFPAAAAGVLAKQEHKFLGAKLQVKYYVSTCIEECPPKDTLEISNLPVNIHVDTLELYLESPKSGGCAGGVKEIKIVSPGIARVQFNSETSK